MNGVCKSLLLGVGAEKLADLKGKTVRFAAGNARIEKEVAEENRIEDIFSTGKNLLRAQDFPLSFEREY